MKKSTEQILRDCLERETIARGEEPFTEQEWQEFLADEDSKSFIRMLEDYGEEIKPKWIPVEEELPPFNKEVLVLGESKGQNPNMGGAYYLLSVRLDIKNSRLSESSDRYVCEHGFKGMRYTTHWMELPEKPGKK